MFAPSIIFSLASTVLLWIVHSPHANWGAINPMALNDNASVNNPAFLTHIGFYCMSQSIDNPYPQQYERGSFDNSIIDKDASA